MTWRRTRSRSRINDHGLEERGEEKERRGVDGRNITVLNDSARRLGSVPGMQPEEKNASEQDSSSNSSEAKRGDVPFGGTELGQTEHQPPPVTRNITFAADVAAPVARSPNHDRVPSMPTAEQNIAFLEKQRNPRGNEILRIPGPRESDRGQDPEALRDDPNTPLSPEVEGQYRHIMFPHTEPIRTRSNAPGMSFARTGTGRSQAASSALEKNTSAYRLRRNSASFSGFHRTGTTQAVVPAYLSWQPTIGRNSAFVDLTEEQREELGGIEYRSLKLLAVILIGKRSVSQLPAVEANALTCTQAILLVGT